MMRPVPFCSVADSGRGLWLQEAGRDQDHNKLSTALLAVFYEVAWNQGIDLYGYDNNRVEPYFDGKVDDFRIYRGPLTAAEVKALSNAAVR